MRSNSAAADALTKPLKEYLDDPSPDAVIVLEAGELPARSSLRKLAESHKQAAAIACYRDEGAGLSALVKEILGAHQVQIAPDALRYVTAQLGADRQASRNALEKLALYAGAGGAVSMEDARAVIGDVAESTLDELAQAVASGQAGPAQKLLQRLYGEGTNTVAILRGLARHFGRLAEARNLVEGGMDAEGAVGKLEIHNVNTGELRQEYSKFSGLRAEEGDVVSYFSPSGGGYGDPLDRDPQKVLDDVLDGFIDETHARDDYGVVLKEVDD